MYITTDVKTIFMERGESRQNVVIFDVDGGGARPLEKVTFMTTEQHCTGIE